MLLRSLLDAVDVLEVRGELDRPVGRVTRDTRALEHGDVFVAIRGGRFDGHDHLGDVSGASAVVVERDVDAPEGPTLVRVECTRRSLAELSAARWGRPASHLRVVGVTGTNGKTTLTTLLEQGLTLLGWPAGRIGTTGTSWLGVARESLLTTPEPPELHASLAAMRDAGVDVVALEVSSIGLAQERVHALPVHLGLFTNLAHDHLDFHGTMEAYAEAKARLFRERLRPVGGRPRALLCADDPSWTRMGAPEDRWTYGLSAEADVRVEVLREDAAGMTRRFLTPEGSVEGVTPLVGLHNAVNLAGALGAALLLGAPLVGAAEALCRVQGVPGRLERVSGEGSVLTLVDYAHTPDALEAALRAVRPATRGQLWVVFGCGGDRDRAKRPEMGRVAGALADRVVVTSDNPRSEDPGQIIEGILGGLGGREAWVEPDRALAISRALDSARPGDTVLIAGKGHETYQEVAGVRRPFDDRAVARRALEESSR